MVKQKIKQQKPMRKPSRHHWFLISVFLVILLLGITAFILQRSTNIEAIAGEAIRQRIAETKQLALTDDQIKVGQAIQEGKETEFFPCHPNLDPAAEQRWKLKEGWNFLALDNVDVQCVKNKISCYYADSETEINRADQVISYKNILNVENCQPSSSGPLRGCNCDLIR